MSLDHGEIIIARDGGQGLLQASAEAPAAVGGEPEPVLLRYITRTTRPVVPGADGDDVGT